MKLVYQIHEKPPFSKNLIYAFQQVLAIMAATILVPALINSNVDVIAHFLGKSPEMSQAAAMFGAGIGTLVYVLFTKGKSPVFLGSSFAFIPSMAAAFAGAISISLGYLGLIIGAIFAGLVYVLLAVVVKFVGVKWIAKLMPAVVIGPVVAVIGISLSSSAIGNLNTADAGGSAYAAVACGLVALFVTMLTSTYAPKNIKLIPFIIGILAGYALALVLTVIGEVAAIKELLVLDFAPFKALVDDGVKLDTFVALPDFTFLAAAKGFKDLTPAYFLTIFVAYAPVAFVVFAEHIADHKNLSTIIDKDLLEDPGLDKTLLGDGVGSIAGAVFGGCPNTTYGESVGCVAISGNASTSTITLASLLCIVMSLISPFVAFLDSIPTCVMGGICIALYGFIAVSGLKMIQGVDLSKNRNLFTVSVILVAGIGGLALTFGKVTITAVAFALILGIITNIVLSKEKDEA
ncbi:MAG: uracil-xanthine permease [Ruminococcaceae bacterium]|nr:uracil-xanthine permease [Oscillospiraceae bacterium]